MKDILDRTLVEGMVCAFNPPTYKGIVLCKIVAFTPKRVRVQYDGKYGLETTAVSPCDLAVLDAQAVTFYYLKKK